MKYRLSIPAGKAASGQVIASEPEGRTLAFEAELQLAVYKATCTGSSAGWNSSGGRTV